MERHIEILLLANDCVIVPGLGGFVAHHVPARYSPEEGLFLPPARTLGFNPQLKMNDSLLVQSYVEAYDISYPEALRRIESDVDELRQDINANGYRELSGLGTLTANAEGTLIFEPCEAGILTPGLYGLSSFEAPAAAEAEQKPAETRRKEANAAPAIAPRAEAEAEEPVAEEAAQGDEVVRIKVSWIRNAAAVAAAVAAFFLITTPVGNSAGGAIGDARVQPAAMLPIATAPARAKAAEPKPAAAPAEPKAEAKAEPTPAPKAEPKAEPTPQQRGYCIVLASKVTKRNADRFVSELKAQGLDKAYTYISDNVVRVAYGQFNTQAEAYAQLRQLRQQGDFGQAWVYRKK